MQTHHSDVTTTDGTVFTASEHADLARLIFKRFGHNLSAATEAWRRLMQNDTEQSEFAELLDYPERTPHQEILQVVVLYPCHGMETRPDCSVWVADEWYGQTRDVAYKDKRQSVREFPSVKAAEDYYRLRLPKLIRWHPGMEKDPDCNFSVTNSHTICKQCQKARRRLPEYC